jgi:site-specific DNA recombinase
MPLPLVRKAFEMAATGQYSLAKLKRALYGLGLRSARSRKELGKQAMSRVLKNPIYFGDFVWKGRTYNGTHAPIITKALFERVQEVMGFVQKPKLSKHDFAFAGLMTCAHCGCAITAERKKGKYVYYHCTNGKAACENVVYIREESIEAEFAKALVAITVPEHIVEWTRDALLESSKEEREFQEKRIASLTNRYRKLQECWRWYYRTRR